MGEREQISNEEKQWFVIEAAHNGALKAKKLFDSLQIESFLPMQLKTVVVKGKKMITKLTPVFHNLIFVNIEYSNLREIKQIHSDLWYMSDRLTGVRKPMIVPENQMREFIDFVDGRQEYIDYIENTKSFDLKEGQRVRITEGPFMGKEGTFVKIEGKRKRQIVVAVEGLMAVTIRHNNPSQIIEKI